MAHFLEHLVFKGGEKYPTYRDVNEAAESIGAVLNAYTSHDLVAFHITVRAQPRARGRRPAHRLRRAPADRRRRARPRARCRRPGDRARQRSTRDHRRAPDRRGGVRRPPARAPRARDRRAHQRHVHAGRDRRVSRPPLVAGRGEPPSRSEISTRCRRTVSSMSSSPGSSPSPTRRPTSRRPHSRRASCVHERDSNQSHLRMSYRPAIDVTKPEERAALVIYSTLLGGSMGSRLFDEIREQRGLAYSVHSFPHAYADVPVLQLSAGLESSKCIEAYQRMREIVTELREQGPSDAEVERARAYAAGARAIAFENTGAVARHAAQQTIVYREPVDPDRAIELLDAVSVQDVRDIAGRVADELSVAVVGPHTAGGAGGGIARRVVAGGFAVVCLALVGCGGGSSSHAQAMASTIRCVVSAHRGSHHHRVSPAMRRLRAGLTAALKKAGPNTGAAVYDLTAHQEAVHPAPELRPPAGIGREAVHDGRAAAQVQADVPPAHDGARRRTPRRRRHVARGPVSARRGRSDVRRRRLQSCLRARLRADDRPARRPALRSRDPSGHRPGDRRRVAVRRCTAAA